MIAVKEDIFGDVCVQQKRKAVKPITDIRFKTLPIDLVKYQEWIY